MEQGSRFFVWVTASQPCKYKNRTAVLIFQNAGPSCGQCEENVGLCPHTILSSSPLSTLSALSTQLPSFLFLLFFFFLPLFSNFYNFFILFCFSFTLVGLAFITINENADKLMSLSLLTSQGTQPTAPYTHFKKKFL